MTSHVHLIISSESIPLNEIIRDLKKFTSKALIWAIKQGPESRKVWLLKKFQFAADRINRVNTFKVWQDGFHPVELDSNTMMEQRLDYVHNNPVEEGIVRRPEDYVYSSAGDYADEKGLIEVSLID
jgi:REP element-mobilizing transposase RayT